MTNQGHDDVARLLELLGKAPPIRATIGAGHAAMLVATIQLAARHPYAPASEAIRTACDIARQMQDTLAQSDPEIGRLLERGWHEVYDVYIGPPKT